MNKTLEAINNEKINKNEVLIWWLGGAGFYLKSKNKKIIIDPYLTNSVYNILKKFFKNPKKELFRIENSPLDPGEINCDYYICTHDHLDHLDPETIKGIYNKNCIKFIGSESCVNHFKELEIEDRNIIKISKGETLQVDNNFGLTAINAKHRGPLDYGASLKAGKEIYKKDDGQGFILRIDDISIYHTSDTIFLEDFYNLKKYNIDVVLLAANGKVGNLTPDEGIKLIKIIEPKIVIPMHYGIIPFTNFNPKVIENLFKKSKIKSNLKILNSNDFFIYRKGD